MTTKGVSPLPKNGHTVLSMFIRRHTTPHSHHIPYYLHKLTAQTCTRTTHKHTTRAFVLLTSMSGYEDNAYCFGGYDGVTHFNTLDVFSFGRSIVVDGPGDLLLMLLLLPLIYYFHSFLFCVIGIVAQNMWIPIQPQGTYIPAARTLHSSVSLDDTMIVFGGCGVREQRSTSFFGRNAATPVQVMYNTLLEFSFSTSCPCLSLL